MRAYVQPPQHNGRCCSCCRRRRPPPQHGRRPANHTCRQQSQIRLRHGRLTGAAATYAPLPRQVKFAPGGVAPRLISRLRGVRGREGGERGERGGREGGERGERGGGGEGRLARAPQRTGPSALPPPFPCRLQTRAGRAVVPVPVWPVPGQRLIMHFQTCDKGFIGVQGRVDF